MSDVGGRWSTLGALGLYLLLAFVFFGVRVVSDFDSNTIGLGEDPPIYIWSMEWWPRSIIEGWDPLHSDVIWAPQGIDMAWVTGIPGPSFVLSPITELAGPVAAYNVYAILIPALNAWAAYLLCRTIGADFWPSVFGGYLFGFSSYVIAQQIEHGNLAFVAMIPLAAYLVARRFRATLSPRPFVAALTATLAFQFLTSTEVFLTLALFAVLMAVVALLALPERRPEIVAVGKLVLIAYVLTAVVVSPYLVSALGAPNALPVVYSFSTDPVNVVVPTELTALGGEALTGISDRFEGGIEEQGAYLGIPLLLIAGLFWWERRDRFATVLLVGAALALLASLGPRLEVLGSETFLRLPWLPFNHLPLLEYAIPIRFIVYAWLLVAVMAALWLSRGGAMRWVLGALAVVSLLPNLALELSGTQRFQLPAGEERSPWDWPRPVPELFTDAEKRRLLDGRGNVVVLPYQFRGNSLLWQTVTDFDFRMAGGYVSATPPDSFTCWPAFDALRNGDYDPALSRDLVEFLRAKQVGVVLVEEHEVAAAAPLLDTLPGEARDSGGVRAFLLPEDFTRGEPADCPEPAPGA